MYSLNGQILFKWLPFITFIGIDWLALHFSLPYIFYFKCVLTHIYMQTRTHTVHTEWGNKWLQWKPLGNSSRKYQIHTHTHKDRQRNLTFKMCTCTHILAYVWRALCIHTHTYIHKSTMDCTRASTQTHRKEEARNQPSTINFES